MWLLSSDESVVRIVNILVGFIEKNRSKLGDDVQDMLTSSKAVFMKLLMSSGSSEKLEFGKTSASTGTCSFARSPILLF